MASTSVLKLCVILTLILTMASVWRHPKSQFWTACFTDDNGRQLKRSTKLTDRNKATLMAQKFEADYRMKLIGIGLERPRTKIPSYVELANPRAVSQNALQRWYFVPNYDCVRMSEDEHAMELVGEGVKLIGENEFVAGDGTRVEAKAENPAATFEEVR